MIQVLSQELNKETTYNICIKLLEKVSLHVRWDQEKLKDQEQGNGTGDDLIPAPNGIKSFNCENHNKLRGKYSNV